MMRQILSAVVTLTMGASLALASAKDDVQAAAQKLNDAPNYSWTTTVEGGMGSNTIDGKTQKDGTTTLSIARQDNTYQAVIQAGKAVVKTEDGWKSAEELANEDNGGGFSPRRFMARMMQNFKAPASQFTDMIAKLDKIEKSDDTYTADLPSDLVKNLLFPRRPNANGDAPEISNASGNIKFWIKDGTLFKVQHELKGNISFNGNDRDIDRTTTTEFKDLGNTTVTIPEDAKQKLNAAATTQP